MQGREHGSFGKTPAPCPTPGGALACPWGSVAVHSAKRCVGVKSGRYIKSLKALTVPLEKWFPWKQTSRGSWRVYYKRPEGAECAAEHWLCWRRHFDQQSCTYVESHVSGDSQVCLLTPSIPGRGDGIVSRSATSDGQTRTWETKVG